MIKKMVRSWSIDCFGGEPRIIESERAAEIPEQSTRVQMRAAQVGHLDLAAIEGGFGKVPAFPFVPGTEGAGIVIESTSLAPDTPVWVRGAGMGIARDGAWADELIVPDRALTPVSAGLDPALVCSFFSPVASAIAVVEDMLCVESTQRVLVTGASGAVGSMCVQLAAAAGAHVIGVVGSPIKVKHVPAVASAVIVSSDLTVDSLNGSVDAVIDTVGGDPLNRLVNVTRPGGVIVVVGYVAGQQPAVDLQKLILGDVSLVPMNLLRRGSGVAERSWDILSRVVAGEFHLAIQEFSFESLPDAIATLRSGAAIGKIVVRR